MKAIIRICDMADHLSDRLGRNGPTRWHGEPPKLLLGEKEVRDAAVEATTIRIRKGLADKRRAKQIAKEETVGARQKAWRLKRRQTETVEQRAARLEIRREDYRQAKRAAA